MMSLRAQIKTVFFGVLIAGCFFMASGMYLADFSHAALVKARKGLPLEMLITGDQLRQKQLSGQRVVVLDSRSRAAYNQGHIKGALHAPDTEAELSAYMKSYPKNTSVVAYCASGGCQSSAVTVLTLKRLGFSDSKNMEEGFEEWEKKGYPVER